MTFKDGIYKIRCISIVLSLIEYIWWMCGDQISQWNALNQQRIKTIKGKPNLEVIRMNFDLRNFHRPNEIVIVIIFRQFDMNWMSLNHIGNSVSAYLVATQRFLTQIRFCFSELKSIAQRYRLYVCILLFFSIFFRVQTYFHLWLKTHFRRIV